MKRTATAFVTVAGASSASALAPFFNTTSTQPFRCPMPFGMFCAGPSMSQNLLMKCEMGMAEPVNCIEHTAAEPPVDDYNAKCFEATPMSGGAGCAKDTMVYPIIGDPFPLPPDQDDPSLPETPSLTASAGATTSFAMPPDNFTGFHIPPPMMPTESPSLPADLSSLPKASLPAYVTTVTLGTKTQFHTIYSDCGNGTMLFGTAPATTASYASWQTGSIPGELPDTPFTSIPMPTPGHAPPPAPEPETIPCDPTSSETSTVSWAVTPAGTTAQQSWIHPTDYATVTGTQSSFQWSAGQTSAPNSTVSRPTLTMGSSSTTVGTEYPSATMGSSFDQGAGAESSSSPREVRTPSLWLMAAAVMVGVAMAC